MVFIMDIVKGILIGIANIIPGVSGGTMAVSLGIYDKLIASVSNLLKDWKASLKVLFPLARIPLIPMEEEERLALDSSFFKEVTRTGRPPRISPTSNSNRKILVFRLRKDLIFDLISSQRYNIRSFPCSHSLK